MLPPGNRTCYKETFWVFGYIFGNTEGYKRPLYVINRVTINLEINCYRLLQNKSRSFLKMLKIE